MMKCDFRRAIDADGTMDDPAPADVNPTMSFQAPDPNRLGSTEDKVIGIEPGRQI
jgi:hypothetical protein